MAEALNISVFPLFFIFPVDKLHILYIMIYIQYILYDRGKL